MPEHKVHSGIWVLAEHDSGVLAQAAHELLGAARRLASGREIRVTAVIWGETVRPFIPELSAAGADRIIAVEDSRFDLFLDEFQADALFRLVEKYRPEILLAPAGITGRALVSRLAALCHTGLTADCIELSIEPETGALLQTRPAFGGSMLATIRSNRFYPQMATVRPGVMRPLERKRDTSAEVIFETAPPNRYEAVKRILSTVRDGGAGHSFDHAGIIVSGGRGINGPAGFELLGRFAARIGGVVGATRPAVEANWIGYAHQVGQTGRTVAPRVYIACGISGQIQHLVGMQASDTIIAVNTDPEASIMKIADVAIVGDANEIIREFLEQTK